MTVDLCWNTPVPPIARLWPTMQSEGGSALVRDAVPRRISACASRWPGGVPDGSQRSYATFSRNPLMLRSRAIASRGAVAQSLGDLLLRVKFAAPSRQFLSAQHLDIVVVAFPGCVRAPAQWRLHGGLRSRRALQHAQTKLQRESL